MIDVLTADSDSFAGFFYGYEHKIFFKKDIDPKLELVTTYIDTATSLIECEHANSEFINQMLEIAAYILVGCAKSDLPVDWVKEHWVVILITVAKRIKSCKSKVEHLLL